MEFESTFEQGMVEEFSSILSDVTGVTNFSEVDNDAVNEIYAEMFSCIDDDDIEAITDYTYSELIDSEYDEDDVDTLAYFSGINLADYAAELYFSDDDTSIPDTIGDEEDASKDDPSIQVTKRKIGDEEKCKSEKDFDGPAQTVNLDCNYSSIFDDAIFSAINDTLNTKGSYNFSEPDLDLIVDEVFSNLSDDDILNIAEYVDESIANFSEANNIDFSEDMVSNYTGRFIGNLIANNFFLVG